MNFLLGNEFSMLFMHLVCQLQSWSSSFLYFVCRYFPFGVDGMLAGSATVFFAYIGFDSVSSTAEEVLMVASPCKLVTAESC